MSATLRALVLLAYGTNRDQDVAEALRLAGAEPEIVPLNALREKTKRWSEYRLLVLPGGFSYADALGAGKLMAIDLQAYFADQIQAFVASGKPVLGICNGFQALVKSGLLPDGKTSRGNHQAPAAHRPSSATLTFNASGHFECRWVALQPVSKTCLWTKGLTDRIECPIAHGEGNFRLAASGMPDEQIALKYIREDGSPADGEYPANPNGSMLDIAGVTNPSGNVLGLMPHPENHIYAWQHPRWRRGEGGSSGLPLFQQGVKYAQGL